VSDPGTDVVVIGGGIIGTAAAAFLAAAGASVTLIESEGLASGASGANSGVVQHPFDPVLAALYRETVTLYRDLSAAALGFRLPDEPAGMLYVSADETAVRRMDRTIAESFPELERSVVGGAALERLEPAVAHDLWACRVGIGFPVHPGASTYAYATLAEQRGARVRQGRAAALDVVGDEVVGVIVDGRPTACDAVLVAAGPWSSALVDPTGRWVPIRRRWGVVVEAELAHGPSHVLEDAGIAASIGGGDELTGPAAPPAPAARGDHDSDEVDFSLVPLPGVASVGSTFLPEQPDPAAWVESILRRAATFVPAVADAPIRGTRSCARPQSADGRPLIGAVPGLRRLFICAGHGPWGISTGPASARLAADQMLGLDPDIPAALDPARFGRPG
jgi:glycine/D-amino acid oxidase-like deaminating enzyme